MTPKARETARAATNERRNPAASGSPLGASFQHVDL